LIGFNEFREIVDRIEYPGFSFVIGSDKSDHFFLQVQCYDGICNVTGRQISWSGRKWRLSVHMTPSEVVQTALKAVLTAVEHEARENFKYRGVSIFDPHYDVEKLVELRKSTDALSERKPK